MLALKSWFQEQPRRIWWAVAAVILPFMGFWLTGLMDLDEGFYGAVVVDMLRRGDWITPTYNGEPWFEKPILLYWLAIPTITFFGEMVGPRMPSVLASLAFAWLMVRFLRPRFGLDVAVLSAMAYGGSVLAVVVGRMMLTDALLVLCFGACLMLFWESLTGKPMLRPLAGACLGLAILAKGPVAGLLFLIIAGIAYWRLTPLRPQFKGGWLLSTLACFLVMGAWYLPCWLVNEQVFVQKFLIEQNIGRFTGGDEAHRVPFFLHPIYYPAVLFVGCLPWAVAGIKAGALSKPSLEDIDEATLLRRFLAIWMWTVLIFFSLSGSKLPHYILPALAPLVILLVERIVASGREIERMNRLALIWSASICLVVNAAFLYWDGVQNAGLRQSAQALRSAPYEVVVFRFGRSEPDTRIKLTLNETSRPSTLFYLRRPSLMTSKLSEALEPRPQTFVILTRAERWLDEDTQKARSYGYEVEDYAPPQGKIAPGFVAKLLISSVTGSPRGQRSEGSPGSGQSTP